MPKEKMTNQQMAKKLEKITNLLYGDRLSIKKWKYTGGVALIFIVAITVAIIAYSSAVMGSIISQTVSGVGKALTYTYQTTQPIVIITLIAIGIVIAAVVVLFGAWHYGNKHYKLSKANLKNELEAME